MKLRFLIIFLLSAAAAFAQNNNWEAPVHV